MERTYLSIGDVLSLLKGEFPDITISKIRFLESQGLLDPERTPSGYRKFYEDDVDRLRWILRQQREHFLPLKVIKGRLRGNGGGSASGMGATQTVTRPRSAEGTGLPAGPAPSGTPSPGGVGPRGQPSGAGGGSPRQPHPGDVRSGGQFDLGVTRPPREGGPEASPPREGGPDARPGREAGAEVLSPAGPDAPEPSGAGPGAGGRQHGGAGRPGVADASPADVRARSASRSATGQSMRRPAAEQATDEEAGGPLSIGLSGVNLTSEELSGASGLGDGELAELERYGLLIGRPVGDTVYYDEEALTVARLAAGFRRFGIEARHLRMYRTAADREASFFEQIVMPLLKQRNPVARRRAVETLAELARLGQGLRGALLRSALKDNTGG